MTESEFKALERKYEVHIPYSNGYENGYADAEAKWLSVIEKITTEIEERATYEGIYLDRADVLDIIDKAVKECTHDKG